MASGGNRLRRVWESFSIYLKLPLLFLTTLLVSTLYYSWYGYQSTMDLLVQSIDARLNLCAEGANLVIPADYPDRALDAGAIRPEEHRALQGIIARVTVAAGLDDLYVFVRSEGRYYEIVGSFGPYYEEYTDDWPSLFATARDGVTRFDDGRDSWGSSRSVILRRTSPGGREYFIGADVALPEIDELRSRKLRHFAVMGLFSFFLVGLISYSIVRLITRPLKRLSDITEATRRDGFSGDVRVDGDLLPVAARPADEVRLLAKNFHSMQLELADHIRRLTETAAARERIESEMRIAGVIQRDLLCREPPVSPRFAVWGEMTPAKLVGGDFYDMFMPDARRLCFAIGDVSGKGVPAAVFMATALTLYRSCSQDLAGEADLGRYVSRVMTRVEEALALHNEAVMFVTAVMGVLDVTTGEVALANAGHNPPIRIAPDGAPEYMELPPGMLLGGGMGVPFEAACFRFRAGEGLLLYTDGITEARGSADELFGSERLLRTVALAGPLGPRGLVGAVFAAAAGFSAGREQTDDMTALCLRWR